jgi:dCTP deaminase
MEKGKRIMILAHNHIKAAIDSGVWTAHRDGKRIGSDKLTINTNSVNVGLGKGMMEQKPTTHGIIDLHDPDSLQWVTRWYDDYIIRPGKFWLMSVRERFDCTAPLEINGQQKYFAPMIEGRSTAARCGLTVHSTAGFGDYGFNSNFTLEVSSHLPIILRTGDEIAQVYFIEVSDDNVFYDGAYTDQHDTPRAPVIGKDRFQRWP